MYSAQICIIHIKSILRKYCAAQPLCTDRQTDTIHVPQHVCFVHTYTRILVPALTV
jgi:hypothetical protein